MSTAQDISASAASAIEDLSYAEEIARRQFFSLMEAKAQDALQLDQFGIFQSPLTAGTGVVSTASLVAVYSGLEKYTFVGATVPVSLISSLSAIYSAAPTYQWGVVKKVFGAELQAVAHQPASLEWAFDDDKAKFQRLVSEWKRNRGHSSKLKDLCMHSAYQQIIGMGKPAVPLLLQEMKERPGHWSWALTAITGDDPVPASSRGKLKEVAQHWLKWGADHGYDQ